jgi:hypothetical protein
MGLTGIGGAIYVTPTLIFLGIGPLEAVGSSVAFLTVAKSWGTFLHIRRKNVDFAILKFLLLGSVLAVIIVYLTLSHAINLSGEATSWFLTIFLSLLLVGIGLHYLLTITTRKTKLTQEKADRKAPVRFRKLSSLLVGALVSSLIQFTSIGGGSLLMPYLMKTMKNPRTMVGTDLFFGFIAALLASILHAGLGNISLLASLPLIIGSLPGTYLGTALTTRIHRDKLLTAIAASLIVVGLMLLSKVLH